MNLYRIPSIVLPALKAMKFVSCAPKIRSLKYRSVLGLREMEVFD